MILSMILLATVVFAYAVEYEYDTDRPGMDYKNFDLKRYHPSYCESGCNEDPLCKAWTYVKAGMQGASARCWLKNDVPPMVKNTCCISGVKPPELITTAAMRLKPIIKLSLNWSPGMWSQYRLKLETDYTKYQTDAKNFEAALEIHDKQLYDCMNKPFTLSEQKNAGCLSSDTWGQCSDKLLKQCMSANTELLENAKLQLINDLKSIADEAVKMSDMVKAAGKSGN